MKASQMLGANAEGLRARSREPQNQTFLYDKVSLEELDEMISTLEAERGNIDPSDVEGQELYQRQYDRLTAAKRRRLEPAGGRQSDRVRASSMLGGLGPSPDPSMSASY